MIFRRHPFRRPAQADEPPPTRTSPFYVVMRTAADIVDFSRPAFQRAIHEEHVESLMRDIIDDWKSTQAVSVLQTVSLAKMGDGTSYVLDGQHRLAALSRLSHEIPLHKVELPVVVYHCATQDDVRHWYSRINHHLPVHPLDLELAWSQKTKPLLETIQRRYRRYISKSASPQCPNVTINGIQSALQHRARELQSDLVTAENMVSDVRDLHLEILRRIPAQLSQDPRLAKCLAKQPDDPCFLGFWRRHEWIDLVLHRRMHGLEWDAVDLSTLSPGSSFVRRTVPVSVRRMVWAKTNDPSSMTGRCYICDEDVAFSDMECAHDIPHCLGGGATVGNMWSTCRSCNRDMGIRRLQDYRESIVRMRDGKT